MSSVDSAFHLDSRLARELAARYSTPLYVLGEAAIRAKVREYKTAFSEVYLRTQICYASKANSTLVVLQIVYQEGCLIDVASEGELRAAILAGVPASACEFHGNNKSPEELELALANGIHAVIVDNFEEIELLKNMWRPTNFLLRLAPGVDPDTHEKISTGQADTKFGFNIADGSAEKAMLTMLQSGLPLAGFHCHVGSQIIDGAAQIAGATILTEFAAEMKRRHGFSAQILNFGGGLGIRYTRQDRPISIADYCRDLVETVTPILAQAELSPLLMQEPGRSIIGECGVTLYTVGGVKVVPTESGPKTYVTVDGGLSDNPRPVMYDAVFTVERMGPQGAELKPCTVSGKHCETDKLFSDVMLPADIARGDILQVMSTGAYNSAMASNYNRFQRPATVLVREDGGHELAQRRETWDEMFARELGSGERS